MSNDIIVSITLDDLQEQSLKNTGRRLTDLEIIASKTFLFGGYINTMKHLICNAIITEATR